MHSLTRIKVLQRRCTVFHSQCESVLLRYQDEDRMLHAEEEAIVEQIAGLKLLLDTLRAENRQLSREEIYSLLRRQSIVRRQIRDLQLQITQIQEKRCELEKKTQEFQEKSKYWLRKEGNYQRWIVRQKRFYIQREIQQEEAESEEII
ncbi:SPI-1 type III secretion system protein SpaM [Salmonella enterica]|nr:SPI-1 type III secretion system protein SpaM [Salmonella enterica]AIP94070.1 type III secretion system protein SpaM [Salmonella enterica subsp. arizonae serovar 62:z36:- str. RKS2983]ASO62356.1 type III secretion system protein SpaM [Salmonella enterica subsp. arizonae serovar 53:-:- str. SA20100345]AXC75989.1 type III secretion system protein SpaM [Salmonella enterica subsp. arizonae serovar 63:g,z51:-]EAN8393642.1 type III secretion system protein SpaM [Salmonella enterica subsp. arizonae 